MEARIKADKGLFWRFCGDEKEVFFCPAFSLPTVRQIRAQCEVKFLIVLLADFFIWILYYNFDEYDWQDFFGADRWQSFVGSGSFYTEHHVDSAKPET